MNKKPNIAVILAAGKGKRLRPHTNSTPKPLLTYNGIPVLFNVIDSILSAKIHNIIFVINHLSTQIEESVTAKYPDHNFIFCSQDNLDGTANALLSIQNQANITINQHGFILVVAADYALPKGYIKDLVDFHVSGLQDISISTRNLGTKPNSQSSIVATDKTDKVTSIIEKPSKLIDNKNIGASLLYIVPTSIIEYSKNVNLSNRNEYEIQAALNFMINEGFVAKALLQEELPDWETDYSRYTV